VRTIQLVARDIGLDKSAMPLLSDGAWNGREVALGRDYDQFVGNRVSVRIAALAPSRLRIRHESAPGVYIAGPPAVECASAPATMAVWADDQNLAQQMFGDTVLAERLAIAIVAKGDSVEIDRREVRVYQSTSRFDGEYVTSSFRKEALRL